MEWKCEVVCESDDTSVELSVYVLINTSILVEMVFYYYTHELKSVIFNI